MKNVIINGAYGKMGLTTCEAITKDENYHLMARLGRQDNLPLILKEQRPDIIIDFTNASVVFDNTKYYLEHKVKAVIGASGLNSEHISELDALAKQYQTGCIIAPNFSIGAILMMKFAEIAAQQFTEVEIVETHHQQKLDAPSGTAVKTAQLIEAARAHDKNPDLTAELYAGARGAEVNAVNIHSLRLPGYIASQQVMFGNLGENLTIQHNSINRDCFMPGVLLACKKVLSIDHLIYGLDNII